MSQFHVAGAVAAMWLVLSASFAILIVNTDLEEQLFQTAAHSPAGMRSSHSNLLEGIASLAFLPDKSVSLWTAEGWLDPTLAVFALALPVPAILVALAQRHSDSDELVFVLSIMSALGTMLAPLWSLRLLGFIGVALGSQRLSEISALQKFSDRIL